MTKPWMFLLLLGIFGFPASVLASGPEVFAGRWSGKGTYILAGDMTQCREFNLVFSASRDTFTFVSGNRVCDKHSEQFYQVTMRYRNGKFLFNGIEVGSYADGVMELRFRQRDGNSFRNWRMFMRREGNHLVYEESRTMDGETTPLISFAGLLIGAGNNIPFSSPAQPKASHPGSSVYPYSLFQQQITIRGRTVDFFAPAELAGASRRASVIVFGHGQALATENYRLMFEHLARKGYAVISPDYSNGFFDRDWRRMGEDYAALAQETMQRFANYVEPNEVIFSGHSKGAYVALVAAGHPRAAVKPSSVVLFAPAGHDADYTRAINPSVPATILFGERDTIIDSGLIRQIYSALPLQRKQLITVTNYPGQEADHYFVMTKAFFMGGRDGISAFHRFGVFKWLIGAAEDLRDKSPVNNKYIYGDEAGDKGVPGLSDRIERNW